MFYMGLMQKATIKAISMLATTTMSETFIDGCKYHILSVDFSQYVETLAKLLKNTRYHAYVNNFVNAEIVLGL